MTAAVAPSVEMAAKPANIERSEREILDLYAAEFRPGPFGHQHLYLYGIGRRALAQSRAFRQVVLDRNSLVAASIVRLQLDTLLRLHALFWVENPEEFAEQVAKGMYVNKLKAADAERMSDLYLRDKLAARNAWVPSVYRETSGFIYFSHRHIEAAVEVVDDATCRAEVRIGLCDVDKPDGYCREMLDAFLHLNMMIPIAAENWFSRTGGPST